MAAPTNFTETVAKGVIKSTWTSFTTQGAVGAASSAVQYPDKTVMATATRWGTGGAFQGIIIEGSNVGVTGPFVQLHDPQGNGVALTSGNPIETILENPMFVRPRLGTATTDTARLIKVYMTSQSTKR